MYVLKDHSPSVFVKFRKCYCPNVCPQKHEPQMTLRANSSTLDCLLLRCEVRHVDSSEWPLSTSLTSLYWESEQRRNCGVSEIRLRDINRFCEHYIFAGAFVLFVCARPRCVDWCLITRITTFLSDGDGWPRIAMPAPVPPAVQRSRWGGFGTAVWRCWGQGLHVMLPCLCIMVSLCECVCVCVCDLHQSQGLEGANRGKNSIFECALTEH